MKFSKEEIDFICDVLKIPVKEEETDESVLDHIWNEACEIEIEESNRLETLTPKGEMAVKLVTKLGDH